MYFYGQYFFMAIALFSNYLLLEKKYSSNTVKAYVADLESFSQFCDQVYGIKSVAEITYDQIRGWLVSLYEEGLSNRSINRKVSSLKAYYNFLVQTQQIFENPVLKHRPLKVSKKLQQPFSEDEINEVISELYEGNDFESVRDRLIVELLYATGIRRVELVNLKFVDVNYDESCIKVIGKRNKERIIPLLPSILNTLKEYKLLRAKIPDAALNTHLFVTKKGEKLYEMLVYRIIKSYFGKVSTKTKRSPHILRHSFATHLLAEGADLNSVKELLGHSGLASTQVYINYEFEKIVKTHQAFHPRSKKS